MRTIIFILMVLPLASLADSYVKGYQRSNGTYVQGHYRTTQDNSIPNNYSSYGNTNPYTGNSGSVSPVQSDTKPLQKHRARRGY